MSVRTVLASVELKYCDTSEFVPLRSHTGTVVNALTDAIGPDGIAVRCSPHAITITPAAITIPLHTHRFIFTP
jgi:hypothetical protein